MRSTTHRATEVAAVLLRHGLGGLVDLFDLRKLLPGGRASHPEAGHPGPEHLRRALEELGPTFMKLGQVLSTRPDLIPPDYEAALALLQDAAASPSSTSE